MSLHRLILRNMGWKITSIVVATLLYITVRLDVIEKSQASDRGRGPLVTFVFEGIPVIVMKPADETNRFVLDPAVVRVKVKARSSVIEETDPTQIKVFADLVNRPMTNQFRLALDLDLSDPLELEYVEPREVLVQVH